ncbi:PREDICTED: myeloid-associated differentiation marker-like [Mandrillus leucophaeus]|uniref:MARVEL domain-containing protein n=1 Tax=Mandrillus leucophaeus TaxID=9568 RepID=A0A2K5XK82_MANLE|nr:PREDICTED: myeloid-associated differentiation marker-like [Mandrillus leucophaeus]
MPVTVTHPTVTTTMGSPTVIGSPRALTQPLGLLRLLQLVSTCMAFSLVASAGAWRGYMGNWSMFTWCFCFAVTLVILLVELGGFQARFPFFWRNFPITIACYAALLCLSASIIYPITYVQFLSHGPSRDHAIAATVFSGIACLAYATEVAWTRAQPGEITGYMASEPGLLKVLETLVACLIFVFISSPYLYHSWLALEWCVVVYAVCFLLAALTILLNLGHCTNMLPIPFHSFLLGLALLSVLLYATALVLWPLYQFNENYGVQSWQARDVSCSDRNPYLVCIWDRRLAVTILTAVNLLAYVGDLVYSAHLVFVKV